VPRDWDISVGAGAEYRVAKHVWLTGDLRWRIPNPVFIVEHDDPVYREDGSQVYGPDGRYLDVPNVLQNTLSESHLYLGALVRF
jgi:hypothetical protein